MAKIFILEDDLTRVALMNEALQGHEIVHVENVEQALVQLDNGPFDLFLLDHDLGAEAFVDISVENTGSGFCKQEKAQQAMEGVYVIIHSWNSGGAANMNSLVKHAKQVPFGISLLNGLRLLNPEKKEAV